jgi:hypothetical protein
MSTYWCKDEMGGFYVLRKSLPSSIPDSTSLNNISEAFVCLPLSSKSDKVLLYFFSDFNYGSEGNPLFLNNFTRDKIKLLRINVLASLVD